MPATTGQPPASSPPNRRGADPAGRLVGMTQTARQTALSVGQAAPDFTLRDQNGVPVSLSEFRGEKNVVVVFYPFAFSGICTGELCEIRDNLGAFVGDDVQVLAISCDHMFSQRGWADKEGYFFPLLSDFWPHGQVARDFGVFNEKAGARSAARSWSTARASCGGRSSTRSGRHAISRATTRRSPSCAEQGRAGCHASGPRLTEWPPGRGGWGTFPLVPGACSSVGRAPRLHRGCRRFETGRAHVLTLADVVAVLEGLYPPETAQSWDQVGLVSGDLDQPVRRIHFAVDPTLAVIEEARALAADLLVTHHPLLLARCAQRGHHHRQGASVTSLVVNDIALYVAHTNADVASPGGVRRPGSRLRADVRRPPRGRRGPAARPGRGAPAHRDAAPPSPSTWWRAAQGRGRHPGAGPQTPRCSGWRSSVVPVTTCSGTSAASGADVYVTADLRHHPVLEAREEPAGERRTSSTRGTGRPSPCGWRVRERRRARRPCGSGWAGTTVDTLMSQHCAPTRGSSWSGPRPPEVRPESRPVPTVATAGPAGDRHPPGPDRPTRRRTCPSTPRRSADPGRTCSTRARARPRTSSATCSARSPRPRLTSSSCATGRPATRRASTPAPGPPRTCRRCSTSCSP